MSALLSMGVIGGVSLQEAWQGLGRAHVVILHLPIGLLAGIALLELLALRRGSRETWRRSIGALLAFCAFSAVFTALLGLLLAGSGGYAASTLFWHKAVGLLLAGAVTAAAFAHWRRLDRLYGGLLVLSLICLPVAGHLGGTLTHGAHFLSLRPRAAVALVENDVHSDAHRILQGRCFSCHGPEKQKGGLRLDLREAALGTAASGRAAVVPHDPMESELVRRILLPEGHGDAMPADGAPLSGDDVMALLRWIQDGAPFGEAPATAVAATAPVDETPFGRLIHPVLEQQCFDCHGDIAEPEGGLNLERFASEADVMADRATWLHVFERLRTGEMPPPKRQRQPTDEERDRVLAWISDVLDRPDPMLGARDPGKPVLRRLNRLEYNNTVRDLLALETDVFTFSERLPVGKEYFDPAADQVPDRLTVKVREYGSRYPVLLPQVGLPLDNRAAHGFNNRGDTLNLSPLLLEKYIELAGEIVRHPELPDRSPVFAALLDGAVPPAARLAGFIERAFRRPVAADEAEPYLAVYETAAAEGRSAEDAMRAAAQAVLASPQFLFRAEEVLPAAGTVRPLTDYEIAGRLSYFLWASMPDEELFAAARRGELRTPEAVAAQARRMLRDPKVRELSETFSVQWLRLDQLYAAKPDRDLFGGFYFGEKDTLHASMLVEALLFFETILIENRSVLEFVDADYAWMNERLIRLYGYEEELKALLDEVATTDRRGRRRVSPDLWFRCALPDDTRGGVVTMAGPLTVTSLPDRTSPVKRGAWLLETVFNRPPAEPKVAFVLSEAEETEVVPATVRERFERHRTDPACFTCHIRIDPPGFALERFDPIGAWRETEEGRPIDASGEWNGMPFDGPGRFKEAVLAHEEEFVRGFIEHLLSYALGRKLAYYDHATVRHIQQAAAEDDYRLNTIISEIVKSDAFRLVRNIPGETT